MAEAQGRSVLVTGGNRGIGLEVARRFAREGDRVAATYRTTAPQEDFLSVQCDVTSSTDVDQAFKEAETAHGNVEVLVANAGVNDDQLLLRMTEESFTSVLDTNLTGAFRVVKRSLKGMLRAKQGRIILISSAVALRGEAGQANYAASKAGLIGFARSLAREYGSRGITVNVVSPGLTATDMSQALSEEQRNELVRQIPVGRLGNPAEIASVVHFLAGQPYITGAVIPVDGGAAMGH
ncbi:MULTISPECIES: 3-oxoacyl-ACP reductase FabG [unclassified Streptomyces]|uniref:3-oxoacyl-ACP reductase FabG n=1 Tax=unclassified Streptomyces TaxID=2593676 RepID=UPI0033BE5044